MTPRFLLSVLMIIVFSGQGFAQNAWKEYTYKSQGYAISFPGNPSPQEQEVETAVGPIQMFMQMHEVSGDTDDANLLYLSNSTEYPEGLIPKDNSSGMEAFFKGALEGAATNVNGTLGEITSIKLGKYSGAEADIDYPAGEAIIRCQIFAKGDTMYLLEVICPRGKEGNPHSNKFFSSFKIL